MIPSQSDLAALVTALALFILSVSALADSDTTPVGDVVEFDGVFEPFREADISPRFDGLLNRIAFEPGQLVQKGDVLFTLMTLEEEYTLRLERLEAEKSAAQLRLAEAELSRTRTLQERDVASEAELDAAAAARDIAATNLELADSRVEMREIIIGEYTLTAPFDGMIGRPLVNEGVYITRSARENSALAVITQLNPVKLTGFVPYDVFAERREILGTDEATKDRIRLTLVLPDGSAYRHTGELTAGGYEFDLPSQRILVSAVFPNPDLLLRPGLRVTVRSEVTEPLGQPE